MVDFERGTRRPAPLSQGVIGRRPTMTPIWPPYRASLLADVYEKYGTRLLELNVRAFLGARGRKSVNAGLRSHDPRSASASFLAYNNGIVATVDAIGHGRYQEWAVSGSHRLRGLQIVNGGQTTASLHRAKRQDGAKLAWRSLCPRRSSASADRDLDEMVAAVSRSANSQNTVQPADFSANDPFHVAVEKLANNTWLAGRQGPLVLRARSRQLRRRRGSRRRSRAGQKRRFRAGDARRSAALLEDRSGEIPERLGGGRRTR